MVDRTSIFIAELLGPTFVATSLALFSDRERFRAMLREFIASPTLLYLAGFFGLLACLALVLVHNRWAWDWPVIVTLIGWITILRALTTLFLPRRVAIVGSALVERRGWFYGAAALNLVIGVVLSYFGYAA